MMFKVSVHDGYPPQETALVDYGLGEANDGAAPLHEVRPLSCFARTKGGRVVGGAVGRRSGPAGRARQEAPPARPPDTQLSAPAWHLPTPKATCGVERLATAG